MQRENNDMHCMKIINEDSRDEPLGGGSEKLCYENNCIILRGIFLRKTRV